MTVWEQDFTRLFRLQTLGFALCCIDSPHTISPILWSGGNLGSYPVPICRSVMVTGHKERFTEWRSLLPSWYFIHVQCSINKERVTFIHVRYTNILICLLQVNITLPNVICDSFINRIWPCQSLLYCHLVLHTATVGVTYFGHYLPLVHTCSWTDQLL